MATINTAPEDVPVKIDASLMSDGRLVEEKNDGTYVAMSMGHWSVMDANGNLVAIPTQCGWRNNPTAIARAYADHVRDSSMNGGAVPLNACPHTTQFTSRLHGDNAAPRRLSPVRDAQGAIIAEADIPIAMLEELMRCNGKPDGCVHFHTEQKRRLAATRAAYDKAFAVEDSIEFAKLEKIMKLTQTAMPKVPRG